MREYGVRPGECVFVTDTVGDVREAQELGIRSVAVTWGFHSAERLAEVSPDVVVESVEELGRVLDV